MSPEIQTREVTPTDIAAQLADGIHWENFAACSEADPELFSATTVGEIGYKHRKEQAQAFCGRCMVRDRCLQDAIDKKDGATYRAGFTPPELRKLIKEASKAA